MTTPRGFRDRSDDSLFTLIGEIPELIRNLVIAEVDAAKAWVRRTSKDAGIGRGVDRRRAVLPVLVGRARSARSPSSGCRRGGRRGCRRSSCSSRCCSSPRSSRCSASCGSARSREPRTPSSRSSRMSRRCAMSSDSPVPVSRTPVPVPRTAVPLGHRRPRRAGARRAEGRARGDRGEGERAAARGGGHRSTTIAQGSRVLSANPAGATAAVVAGAAAVGLHRLGGSCGSTRAEPGPRRIRRARAGHARARDPGVCSIVRQCDGANAADGANPMPRFEVARRLLERLGRLTEHHESQPHEHTPHSNRRSPSRAGACSCPAAGPGATASPRTCATRVRLRSSLRSSTSRPRTTRPTLDQALADLEAGRLRLAHRHQRHDRRRALRPPGDDPRRRRRSPPSARRPRPRCRRSATASTSCPSATTPRPAWPSR